MNKSKFLSSVLIFWILGWIYFGIEQVQISIDYKFSQHGEESMYEPGYKVIEKNGTKFLIKDTENFAEDIPTVQDEKCFTEELLAQLNHAFDYENNQLYLSFGENTPEHYGIHKLNIQLEPDFQYFKNNDMLHNIYSIDLPTDQHAVSLPIDIYQTEKIFDISLSLNGSGKTNYQRDCLTSKVTKINTNIVKNFSEIHPYFSNKSCDLSSNFP